MDILQQTSVRTKLKFILRYRYLYEENNKEGFFFSNQGMLPALIDSQY